MNRLHIKRLLSIGTVAKGDDPEATILLYKSLDESEKTKEPEPGLVEKKGDSMPFDIESLGDEAKAHVEGLVAQIAELTETPEPLPEDLPDLVTKRLDDQADAIEKERVDKERISKELADLKDEMATEKYTARAGVLENLLGKPDEVAPVLQTLAKDSPEAFGKLDEMFNTLIVKDVLAPLMAELGDTSATGSANDQITVFATEIRKNSPDTTAADARMQAWTEHPDLRVLAREEGN